MTFWRVGGLLDYYEVIIENFQLCFFFFFLLNMILGYG